MKFEKILKSLIEQTLPSWRDKFLCYKILKKQLKLMCSEHGQIDANQLNRFLNLLQLEIDKFNTFFIEKEEEYVIKGKVINQIPTYIFISSSFLFIFHTCLDILLKQTLTKTNVSLQVKTKPFPMRDILPFWFSYIIRTYD